MITEYCSHCEQEVDIQEAFHKQKCPECGKPIKPCSMCNMDEAKCNECLVGEDEE